MSCASPRVDVRRRRARRALEHEPLKTDEPGPIPDLQRLVVTPAGTRPEHDTLTRKVPDRERGGRGPQPPEQVLLIRTATDVCDPACLECVQRLLDRLPWLVDRPRIRVAPGRRDVEGRPLGGGSRDGSRFRSQEAVEAAAVVAEAPVAAAVRWRRRAWSSLSLPFAGARGCPCPDARDRHRDRRHGPAVPERSTAWARNWWRPPSFFETRAGHEWIRMPSKLQRYLSFEAAVPRADAASR